MSDEEKKTPTREEMREERRERRQEWRDMRHQMHQEYWESRIFGAFTLIIIGVIFLLNTTGVLGWNVWLNILRFWPLFIVSAGVSIIFSGTRVLKFIGSIITFLIFIVIVFLAVFNPFVSGWNIFSPFTSNTSSQGQESTYVINNTEYTGVITKSLNVDLPIGEFNLVDTNSTNYLDVTSTYYSEAEKLVITKSLSAKNLAVVLSTDKTSSYILNTSGPKYNVQVGHTDLPSDFTLKFGAGSGGVVFTNQVVNDFNAEVGAGSLDMNFSKISLPTGSFFIKSGLGSITLTLPKTVGIKLVYKVGLGSLSINNTSITNGVGNAIYYSDNYESASKTVEINVEVGLGSINIITE